MRLRYNICAGPDRRATRMIPPVKSDSGTTLGLDRTGWPRRWSRRAKATPVQHVRRTGRQATRVGLPVECDFGTTLALDRTGWPRRWSRRANATPVQHLRRTALAGDEASGDWEPGEDFYPDWVEDPPRLPPAAGRQGNWAAGQQGSRLTNPTLLDAAGQEELSAPGRRPIPAAQIWRSRSGGADLRLLKSPSVE
jgi:hypothetical protein